MDALVPGLYIHAVGKGDEIGELAAKNIEYSAASLRTFRQVDARGAIIETQVTAVEQPTETLENRAGQVETRTAQLDKEGKQTQAQVNHTQQLTPSEKQKLDRVAQEAKVEKGCTIQVAGLTDKTGSASYNDELSEARALAVIRYLQQADGPLYRISAPAGMGISHPVADNHTRTGRKLNRRVEVSVLVNQGLAGPTQSAVNSIPTVSTAANN